MIPGGALAAIFLLSLVPGYVFLRLSATARRPRQQSPLAESLEVVAVGIATTGSSFVFWVLVKPGAVLTALDTPDSSADLRRQALLAVVILGLATGLACIWSWALQRRRPNRFQLSVWYDVFSKDNIPKGHLAFVAVQLTNGVTVSGNLHSYTWAPDTSHRDISLTRPIVVTRGKKSEHPDFDFLSVSEEQIRHIAVKYARNEAPG